MDEAFIVHQVSQQGCPWGKPGAAALKSIPVGSLVSNSYTNRVKNTGHTSIISTIIVVANVRSSCISDDLELLDKSSYHWRTLQHFLEARLAPKIWKPAGELIT
ncbi:hypothetical protein C8R21_1551 [Nitrosospira multiformis]|uniref:Uncharacterized protein n=1 Tax=Nitrosospira multiformis TaxID=1231 RepID=A0A2T5I058_9PROT|nr:hypothetical protein C8R21_1551 [Nitrosospira multiformis]